MYITEYQKKELKLAKALGVIKSDDPDYLQELMEIKNKELNENSFGKTSYDEFSFVSYIMSRFRMDFIFGIYDYPYRKITSNEISNYYKKNKILFLRENGDYFPEEEVEEVIKKHLRQKEYEEAVVGLLH